MMNLKNNDTATFLVPEIVQRSRAVSALKMRSEKASPHVKKVYESKVRHIEKIQKQNDKLSGEVNGLDQKESGLAMKQAALLMQTYQVTGRTSRLEMTYKKLKDELVENTVVFEKLHSEQDSLIYEIANAILQPDEMPPMDEIENEKIALVAEIEKLKEETSRDELFDIISPLEAAIADAQQLTERYEEMLNEESLWTASEAEVARLEHELNFN